MENKDYQNKIFTIPNVLSTFRLVLIPVFVWLYLVKKDYTATTYVLLLSGATDIADGFIARHFHMISNVGKVLDPIADKLTQAAMLFCLFTNFPLMIVLLILLVVKDIFMGVTGFLAVRKTGDVYGAKWHGKVVTALLYATMILHVIWYEIPMAVSNVLIIICIAVMVVSLVLYGKHNIKALKEEH